jgi:5-methylcytosine-specific restriction endonuclease McrA
MKNCTYCGSSLNIQDDHIIAQTKGGVTTTPACANCNQSKGKKALMEWLRWIKRNNQYRWKRITDFHYGKRSDVSIKVRKIRDEK